MIEVRGMSYALCVCLVNICINRHYFHGDQYGRGPFVEALLTSPLSTRAMTMVEEGEEAESIIDSLLNAVSASGAHTKYWNMLISCFPPPHQQTAAPPTRSTSSTRLPVLLERFGQRTKENLPADGNTTLLTVQQCVAEDINVVGARACISSVLLGMEGSAPVVPWVESSH